MCSIRMRAPVLGRLLQELRQGGQALLRLLRLVPDARPACARQALISCESVLPKQWQLAWPPRDNLVALHSAARAPRALLCKAGREPGGHKCMFWLFGSSMCWFARVQVLMGSRCTSAQRPVLRQELREEVGVRPPLAAGPQLRPSTNSWLVFGAARAYNSHEQGLILQSAALVKSLEATSPPKDHEACWP